MKTLALMVWLVLIGGLTLTMIKLLVVVYRKKGKN